MEVKQRIVSCPNGHYYDANASATCPLCEGIGMGASFGGGSFSETVMAGAGRAGAGMGAGSGAPGRFQATVAPESYGAGANFQPRQVAHDFGRTEVPTRVSGGGGTFSHTVSVDSISRPGQVSPVVGWLVAITGPCRGTDWRIHANYNYIGREAGDIRVHGDPAISAQRDSSIAYVVKTGRFYIAHEQGLNTVLVNDEPVMGTEREIKSFDIITIGSTQFAFVALCGPQFDWESEKKSNNA